MKTILFTCTLLLIGCNLIASDYITNNYRWRNDDGDEKTATWKAPASTAITISDKSPIRLRIGYINIANASEDQHLRLKLKYGTYYDTETPLTDVVSDDTNSTAPFILVGSPHFVHGTATTQQITGSSNFTAGKMIGQLDNGTVSIDRDKLTEIEWCIKPTKYAKPGTPYYFMADNMPELSPAVLATSADFGGKSADSITRYSLHPSGNNVTIKWTTALNDHDHFVLQRSYDNIFFDNMVTIPGGTGKNFSYSVPLIESGTIYVRMKLYDENNVESISRSIKFNLTTRVKFDTASAARVSGNVKIMFNTTHEVYNITKGFALRRSYDKTASIGNWQFVAKIDGQGWAPNKITNYSYTDEVYSNPADTIYYVINYEDSNVSKQSDIITLPGTGETARSANNLTLDVYPNPATSGKISFDLKGYKGKKVTATLTSLYGKQIGKETFVTNANGNYVLNTTATAGTYVLNINGEGVAKTGKVLVQ